MATYVNGITAKAIDGKFGEFFNISINLEKLKEFENEKWYVNLVMNKRKEVWKYGETHSFTINEWTPKEIQDSKYWNPWKWEKDTPLWF